MMIAGIVKLFIVISCEPYAPPPASAPANAVPDAPQGYVWKHLESINANFLMPKGWYFTKRSNKHGSVFLFRKDEPEKPFLTGLTVNVTKEVTKISHIKPSLYAVHFMQNYTKDLKITYEPEMSKLGKFQRLIFEVIKKIPETKTEIDFRVRVVVVANDETDTMYTILFGAPEKEWKKAWKIGKVLLGMYTLDDDA
jgi:hypothetical protein